MARKGLGKETAPRRRLRILVVDDNLDQVHTMAYLLTDMGHHVDYAINGIVALELAQRTRPEVVLLDVRLPDATGLQIARQLRRYPELKDTPIVGVTGFPFDEKEALAAGLSQVLAKPVDFAMLEGLLDRL